MARMIKFFVPGKTSGSKEIGTLVQDDEGTFITDIKEVRTSRSIKNIIDRGWVKHKGDKYEDSTLMDGIKLVFNQWPYIWVQEVEV